MAVAVVFFGATMAYFQFFAENSTAAKKYEAEPEEKAEAQRDKKKDAFEILGSPTYDYLDFDGTVRAWVLEKKLSGSEVTRLRPEFALERQDQ